MVGGLTGQDLIPAINADCIILRRHVISAKGQAVRDLLMRATNCHNYERIVLAGPDVPFENRESPDEHLFTTPTEGSPRAIFHERQSG